MDDLIYVSGHRLSTAEIENALRMHPSVLGAAATGFTRARKAEGISCFVRLRTGTEPSAQLERDLVDTVRKAIRPIASPDVIQWASDLPQTDSAKTLRRILGRIAKGDSRITPGSS